MKNQPIQKWEVAVWLLIGALWFCLIFFDIHV